MPKATTPTSSRHERRHNPLEADILATGLLRQKAPKRKARDDDDKEGEAYVESRQSKTILKLGQELLEEDQAAATIPQSSHSAFDLGSRFDYGDDEPNEGGYGDEDPWADEDEEIEEVEVDADDLAIFNKFLPDEQDEDPLLKHGWDRVGNDDEGSGQTINLADVILAKIAEHEAAMERRPNAAAPDDHSFPPRVLEVYTKIGLLYQRYKSGKIPKPAKILPTIPGWEELLQPLAPDLWTPNAVYEVTKIFASAKPAIAQRWMELVVLDRVREDIRETKKLNVHLFNALKKSLYKPSAFFKGFLFPLVASGCTIREARIVAGVLTRTSVPVLHSAAAIKGLCDISAQQSLAGTAAGNAANIFIETLLIKKYALPFQVIDSLVFFFLRYRAVDPDSMQDEEGLAERAGASGSSLDRSLPVIFHRCLLAFAQRYKNDITEDQREALLDLLLTHGHSGIGPEVRRELLAGRGRGVAKEPSPGQLDGDDTMVIDS